MNTRTCLLCETTGPSRPDNHLCDDCIEQGKLYARLRKRKPRRRRKKKERSLWISFIGMDPRIVDEVRFRFQERFSKTEPYTEDEKDFVQQLFLTYVKARKRYDPGHASAANLYTFINRSFDRHIKYLDRTRLTDSRAIALYAEEPEPVYEADYFCIRTSMRHEHYRQLNGQRHYYQKPPHFNLGLDIACFAAEQWTDVNSLRSRTAETLQTLSGHQLSAFELLIAGHTQKDVAEVLEKSTSWLKRQAKYIRIQFGLKPQKRKLKI